MTALNYLNQVIAEKSARVPENLVDAVVGAALALGVVICGGYYNPENQTRTLYLA